MVDCFDRIHLRLAETVLRPLKELHARADLTSVTVRPPGRGPRIYVTVSKTWPEGPDRPPAYHWSASEATSGESARSNGKVWVGETPRASPEDAYWCALEAVAASRRAVTFA
jgi:hypothetical protein